MSVDIQQDGGDTDECQSPEFPKSSNANQANSPEQ